MIETQKLEQFAAEISDHKDEAIDNLLRFFMTDMMFFWGEEKGLIEQQEQVWGPLLSWAEEEFDTKFVKAKGLKVPEQDMQSGYRIKFFMQSLSDKELTVFYFATYTMKSVLLAAAFVRRKITPEQAFLAASLEEVWQQKTWGVDDAIAKRHQELKGDIEVLYQFLD